jgi:hypothetical protein
VDSVEDGKDDNNNEKNEEVSAEVNCTADTENSDKKSENDVVSGDEKSDENCGKEANNGDEVPDEGAAASPKVMKSDVTCGMQLHHVICLLYSTDRYSLDIVVKLAKDGFFRF